MSTPRVTLKGRWGPRRIGFLLSFVLLSVGIWRSQGPIAVVIVVALGLGMAFFGVMLERRWLRHSAKRSTTEET